MERKRSPQSTRAFSFWESCHWPHATIAVERISFVHWQLVHKLATVQVPSPPRNFSLWNNPKQQDGVSRVSEECTIEKRWATCIADYNKYMGGIDCTDQLLKPYEVPRKHWSGSRRWPSTLCSFPCSTSSLFIRRVVIKKQFLRFQHEVIAALLFENGNGADIEIPREENITRLTEHHFVSPIPVKASKQKPQKRCQRGVHKEC